MKNINNELAKICQRIKMLIDEKDLSYRELSNITGIPKSAIHRYTTGQTPKIPLDRIQKIAEAFNVTASWIMGWEDDENEKAPDKPEELTEGEKIWLKLYNELSAETKEVLVEVANKFERLPVETQEFLLGAVRVALNNQK